MTPAKTAIPLSITSLFLAIIFGLHPIDSFDTFWHLASGQWIWEHGQIPTTDIFSYTAFGKPWIHHEWGAGVIFWFFFSQWGVTGLTLLQLILFWGILYFAGKTIRLQTTNRAILFIGLFVLAWMVSPRIMVRPHLFSLFFYSLLFFIFNKKDENKFRLLPPLFLLWANLHGEALIGLGLFMLYVGRQIKLFPIVLMCALLLLVNPYGIKIFTFPFEHVGQTVIMSATQEMIPFYKSERWHHFIYGGYVVLLFLTLFQFIKNPKRFLIWEWMITLLLIILSLRANRFVALFSLWTIPLLARCFKESYPQWVNRSLMAIPILCCLFFSVSRGIPLSFSGGIRPIGMGFASFIAPDETVRFLQENKIQTRFFNDFELGAYLILKQYPVFIDGRTPVFGDDFYQTYIASHFFPPVFDDLKKEWNFGVVILARQWDKDWVNLHTHLMNSPDWALVHVDDVAYIYLDHRPEHKATIQKYQLTSSPAMRFKPVPYSVSP